MIRTTVRLLAAAVGLLSMLAGPVFAEDYPSRPIKVLIGFPAGSSIDVNLRTFMPALQKVLGVPVVVENRPGAGGAVAWNDVANARPDGYTLGSVNYPAIAGVYATGGLPFDPMEKFAFLGNIIYEANIIAVGKNSPYKSLSEMVDYLKANPSGLSYGSDGIASLDGLVALAVGSKAGVKFRSVNFEGSSDALAALLGGHIDAMGMSVSMAVPLMQSGDVRAMGVGGNERNPLMPDVPTFAEQGIPLAVNAASRGLVIQAGADPAIIEKLRAAIKTASQDPDYIATAKKMSQAIKYIPPEQVRDDIQKQIDFIKTIVPPK
ncbi:MAG TPA: tripartite tricarboxylate transporter substrate binding protein [Dongiaceae bacterium]|nr:tripartite tricarboxylate transporter substrate binding protein [Dongiaceae bacterium]